MHPHVSVFPPDGGGCTGGINKDRVPRHMCARVDASSGSFKLNYVYIRGNKFEIQGILDISYLPMGGELDPSFSQLSNSPWGSCRSSSRNDAWLLILSDFNIRASDEYYKLELRF